MRSALKRQWFLIALAAVLITGVSQAAALEPLADLRAVRYGIVAAVLFVMALPIDARAMTRSLRRPGPPLLAVGINFGLLPLVAWATSLLLRPEMAGGIYVAAATPCTLASAAVWTRRAGGNDSVAILVTVITNLSCFLVTPVWLLWMTGKLPDVPHLRLDNMILKLGLIVVLPMAFAQLLRLSAAMRSWSGRRRAGLNIAAQIGVLSMILLGAIQMGLKLSGDRQLIDQLAALVLVTGVVIFIHVSMLVVGLWSSRRLGFTRADAIAVGIAGSQKTLLVGLQTGLELGLSILPMVIYHVSQLLLDTVIADRLRRAWIGEDQAAGEAGPEPAGRVNGPCR